ncbi:hypothetical protein D3C85_1248670 [compost metagenome]
MGRNAVGDVDQCHQRPARRVLANIEGLHDQQAVHGASIGGADLDDFGDGLIRGRALRGECLQLCAQRPGYALHGTGLGADQATSIHSHRFLERLVHREVTVHPVQCCDQRRGDIKQAGLQVRGNLGRLRMVPQPSGFAQNASGEVQQNEQGPEQQDGCTDQECFQIGQWHESGALRSDVGGSTLPTAVSQQDGCARRPFPFTCVLPF